MLSWVSAYSQTITIDNSLESNQKIENIIRQYRDFGKDTLRLKSYLAPLLHSSDKKLQSVYYSLLANGLSKAIDKVNLQSDHYYKKSIETAKVTHHPGLEVWALVNYAFYLYNYSKVTEALQIYMDADQKINKTETSQLIFPSLCYKNLGYFFGTIGDTKEAISYLKNAEKYAQPHSRELASIKDNIAYYLITINQFSAAEKYLQEALDISFKIKDYERYAKALGNYGRLNHMQKNYAAAIQYYKDDLKFSKQAKAAKNTMFAHIELSKVLFDNNQIAEAKAYLNEAINYARSKFYYMKFEKEIQELNLKIAIREKNVPQELFARRRLDVLEDSLAHLDSQKNLDRNNILAQKERYASKLSLANAQYEKEQLKTRAFIVIATLLLLLLLLIVFINKKQEKNRKNEYEKKVLQLQLDKVESEQKLDNAHITLASLNTYLTEKNLQIENLNKEISIAKTQPSFSILEKREQKLQSLLDSHLMTNDNWQKFKSAFQNEQKDFYNQLISDFPDFTESNLRIILLSKLGLSNQDVSSLLGVTIDAVKKAKQRLKKKIGSDYNSILEEL